MKKTQEPLIFHSGKNYGPESASRDITDKILLSNFFSQRQLDHRNVETSTTTKQKDKTLMVVFKAKPFKTCQRARYTVTGEFIIGFGRIRIKIKYLNKSKLEL